MEVGGRGVRGGEGPIQYKRAEVEAVQAAAQEAMKVGDAPEGRGPR